MQSDNLEKIRHSLAHILARAVQELYPKANLGMGPATENGFYYDFGNITIKEEDLPKIEERMRDIIKKEVPFQEEKKEREEAQKLFAKEPYKLEIIDDMKEKEELTVYKTGDFVDLCEGPHVEDTGKIDPNTFILDRVAGAYFKGSEKNEMLQRVYGLAFNTKEDSKNLMWQFKEQ